MLSPLLHVLHPVLHVLPILQVLHPFLHISSTSCLARSTDEDLFTLLPEAGHRHIHNLLLHQTPVRAGKDVGHAEEDIGQVGEDVGHVGEDI